MSRLLIAAPLRVEAFLLASAAPRAAVHRTGVGHRHSIAAARRLAKLPASAVLVMGFCGALEEALEPGDLIVADELLAPARMTVACAASDALAARLSDCALTVHRGVLASVRRPATGTRRGELRRAGASAVDMESAWLAPGAAGRPFGVVRAIVDTPTRELWRPLATVTGGVRAARSLRHAAAALNDWMPED